jgi:hypothetical protein
VAPHCASTSAGGGDGVQSAAITCATRGHQDGGARSRGKIQRMPRKEKDSATR